MSHFAKRHYEAIADVLQSCAPYSNNEAYEVIIQKFANMLENDNPLFQRKRFKAACQPGANVRARS